MGCIVAKRVNDTVVDGNGSVHTPKNNATKAQQQAHQNKTSGVQDDARSFRSKVGAIKMISRSDASFCAFLKYLETDGFAPFLHCFRDMEEIKKLAEDQMISRTAALIWRYKVIFENVKILGQKPDDHEYLIWECLGKLRQIDVANAPASLIMKHLLIAQNEILARLVKPFEAFLQSPQYKTWQEELLEQEKMRERAGRVHKSHATPTSATRTAIMSQLTNANTHKSTIQEADSPFPSDKNNCHPYPSAPNSAQSSSRIVTFSDSYPDILIVDDSLVTLKLTGLTLEKDGHHVERAHNGQVALQLMKSRPYDVVLIDINMPVMDGFETVRLFREFEKNNQLLEHIPSDMSSISDSEGDFEHSIKRNKSKQASSKEENSNVTNVDLANYEKALRKPNLTAAHYHQLIIGISTNVDEETRKKAFECGMDYFLIKPFSLQKFVEVIRLSRMSSDLSPSKTLTLDDQSVKNFMDKPIESQDMSGVHSSMSNITVSNTTVNNMNIMVQIPPQPFRRNE